MIPDVGRDTILEALDIFDTELRNAPEWAGWESNGSYKYAVEHKGKYYPAKKIISLATGVGVNTFSMGETVRGYLQNREFDVVPINEAREMAAPPRPLTAIEVAVARAGRP